MLLDVKSVDKKFNGVYALKGLDFSLGEGEVHGLIGEERSRKVHVHQDPRRCLQERRRQYPVERKDLPEVIRPEESRKLGINIIFQDNV